MEDVRIGVYICWCGSNIAKMVDVEEVARFVGNVRGVVVARAYKYMCSDPGQDMIVADIQEHRLTRVVVAACSPRMHEVTFRRALERGGLNPYLFEMANIREQDSWVHEDRARATRKAKALAIAAIERVRHHVPLEKRAVGIHPATLVIGGGIAGMTAALEIAAAGRMVYIVEKRERLGGLMAGVDLTYPHLDGAQTALHDTIERVAHNPDIEVFTNSIVGEITGYMGNFEAEIAHADGSQRRISFGHVVVATGLKPFNPAVIPEYGYGKLPNVVTSVEFEAMLAQGRILTKDDDAPRHIALIHCVGSRNPDHNPYCSRVCCATALKYANQIRSALPDVCVYDIYADMRAMGRGCEELYARTAKRDVMFLMFDQRGDLPRIRRAKPREGCRMIIDFDELLSGERIEVPADLVVLMVGLAAHTDSGHVAHVVGISRDANNFFIEKHPKLDPVATTTDGVFIIGACQAPKDIADCVSQARAAAGRILAGITRGSVNVEAATACASGELCCGCRTCVRVCPYGAISFNKDTQSSVVNDIICKGCGTCSSSCPAGAITSRHFTDQQILAEIDGIMRFEMEAQP